MNAVSELLKARGNFTDWETAKTEIRKKLP